MYEESQAKLSATREAVEQFVRDRIGLSVHWGLYSLIGKGEWVMHTDKIPVNQYEKLMALFNPTDFDAEQWISLVKDAGIKAFMITSKHHDGFCLFDSRLTEYKVTNTAFKRDPIKEISDACHKYNIKLHFYYSLLDWHHGCYQSNWKEYVRYYQGQIRELCTNYGKIAGIVFDGWWPRFKLQPETEYFRQGGCWDLTGTYDLIHTLQPDALITNNHHILPLKGEDYQIFEIDMPGENTAGFNTTEIGDKPLATWISIARGWSYIKENTEFKTLQYIRERIEKCREKNIFLWLNSGPMPDGRLQPEEIEVLKNLRQSL